MLEAKLPAAPGAAVDLFGSALPVIRSYGELLAGPGVERGLIGPREVDRLWERHLMNCAAVVELIPHGAHVVDVGSGGGLPGVVLAAIRPDLRVTLLEPLLRRTAFLEECLDVLELDNAEVLRARAEDWARRMGADVVTARAVAPTERLVGWCLPLLRPGGRMLALKGEAAADELAAVEPTLAALGAKSWRVVDVGETLGNAATRVIRIDLGPGGFKPTGARRTREGQRFRRGVHG
ncbi:16S rRNA (guanine(527)-N(7))-methyltransferase RsmG [Actinocrinis puniceicyclus]|uniref:Ribosomal RNA small subunit methyltransferase G n=1 Tax=Actinocrinis puniceicyclus TaxID=977794 RepID=A0A8J8B9R7_9ACTN|nr:16S rRNA (guanine(527)-N(7))-methyltransferase RsmG [Actinocrinis puniceicyclus]MBS2962122.1 16S rRNA (guanine(527)-N(7))-methyltransferase RsmG [Actinocrinis puniceicyclus]